MSGLSGWSFDGQVLDGCCDSALCDLRCHSGVKSRSFFRFLNFFLRIDLISRVDGWEKSKIFDGRVSTLAVRTFFDFSAWIFSGQWMAEACSYWQWHGSVAMRPNLQQPASWLDFFVRPAANFLLISIFSIRKESSWQERWKAWSCCREKDPACRDWP